MKILQIFCYKSVPGQNIRLAVFAVCAKQTMLFPLGEDTVNMHTSHILQNIPHNTNYNGTNTNYIGINTDYKIMIIQVQMIIIQIFPWEEDTVIHILQSIAFTGAAGSDFLFLTLFPQKL